MLLYLTLIDSEEDKRKFERLYLDYRKTMYYAAYEILRNVHSAEDAVHQAFLRVVDNLDKIDESNCHKTRGFLVVITEHIAIDIYRKRKREDMLSYDEFEIYISDNTTQNYDDADEMLQILKKLPINYSTILVLKYSQGYTDSEISQLLDITEDNVRQRIVRAKKKLSQLLQKGCNSE